MKKPGRPGRGRCIRVSIRAAKRKSEGLGMLKRRESEQPSVVTQASEPPQQTTGGRANVGQSMVFKGELTVSENLNISGHVEGKIILHQHALTVGPTGKVKGEISAKAVIVLGQVTGNITAAEKIDMREKSSVEGDIAAPRVVIAEGVHFRGSIDMPAPRSR